MDRLGRDYPGSDMPLGPRIPLDGGGILDYSTRRIYDLLPHGPIPNGAFVDSLGLVRHPLDGHVIGQLNGNRIVPPGW